MTLGMERLMGTSYKNEKRTSIQNGRVIGVQNEILLAM